MIAEIRAVYPKGVKKEDLFEFKIRKQIELPVISMTDDKTKRIFFKNGKVIGTPVLASIKDLKSNQVKTLEGILIDEPDGEIYVIPKEFIDNNEIKSIENITKTAGDLIKEAGAIADETTKPIIKEVEKIDTESTLGFTKKQLLVIAVTVLVLVKIFK